MARLSDDEIIERLVESEYKLTENIAEAIYILRNGTLIDGDYCDGVRGEDHRMIESVTEYDRYDEEFWDEVHDDLGLVRLVPETNYALIGERQELTSIQEDLIKKGNYEIERY